jgi:hypothetical protein
LGLWTLALAANRFRSDALPENAVTMRQLIHKQKTEGQAGTPYVHFKVDLDSPDQIERDGDGVPVMLHQWDVVWASNPERALKAHPPKAPLVPLPSGPATGPVSGASAPGASGAGPAHTGDSDEGTAGEADGEGSDPDEAALFPDPDGSRPHEVHRPASQRAADHRQVLRHSVTAARDSLDRLLLLEPEVGNHTPIVPVTVLDELHKLLIGLQTDVENLRRKATQEDNTALEDEDALEDMGV